MIEFLGVSNIIFTLAIFRCVRERIFKVCHCHKVESTMSLTRSRLIFEQQVLFTLGIIYCIFQATHVHGYGFYELRICICLYRS